MTRAIFALLLAGCGAASPCLVATAGGERYCAISCAGRENVPCPAELPHRTETPEAVVCRAEEGPLDAAICEQLPGGCDAPPPPPVDAWRASLAELGVELVECDGGSFGLRWPGASTADEALIARAMQVEGVIGAGLGTCCVPGAGEGRPPLCLRVQYRRSATDPVELARALAPLRAEGAGLTVQLDPSGPSGPRCGPDSPHCLPEAYEGCAATTYRAGAARTVVDIGSAAGACRHDGECMQAGCGNDCVAWTLAGGAGTCEAYALDHPVYCGCVEGRCAWFRQ
ncbi:MAG TPA: hypothetical protein VIL20_30690 [Sandaracinaceae bacterium]